MSLLRRVVSRFTFRRVLRSRVALSLRIRTSS